jgi:hypothetical protein
MPVVSVVMPVRDALPTLDGAVESLLAQSLGEIEIVAVDDGSTDGSRERLEAWARRDGRVRVLATAGTGIVDALNLGVRASSSELVARMDADDVCHPERLARQAARIGRAPRLDVVGCGAWVVSDGPAPGLEAYHDWVSTLVTPAQVRLACLVESPLVHPGVMSRRDLLLARPYRSAAAADLCPGIPPHDGSAWPEDYDLWLSLLRSGAQIANLPERLVGVRWHEARTTLRAGFTTAAMARLKLDHLLRTVLEHRPAVVIQGAGRHGKMWLRLLAGAGVPVTALLDVAARRHGRSIDGVPVHPVERLPSLPRALVVVAVGQKGPNTRRSEVRAQLDPMGLEEGRDYVFVC